MKWFILMLCLAPLGCGGGEPSGPNEGESEGEAEGEGEGEAEAEGEAYGTILATAEPEIASSVPFQLVVDDQMMAEIPVGESGAIDVLAGSHDVKIVCPGYGYAVPGWSWGTSENRGVADWIMRDLEVPENSTIEVNAVVCRDLTGTWDSAGEIREVRMDSEDGVCEAHGFSPFGLEIRGDLATVIGDTGCAGVTAPIEGGNTITLDCGGGVVYTYRRVTN